MTTHARPQAPVWPAAWPAELDRVDRELAHRPGEPLGFTQVTVGAAVARLAPPDRARSAALQVLSGALRWRVDGAAPTATTGHRVETGAWVDISGRATLAGLAMVRDGATDAVVAVTFFD
jgi:hypothetical protein